MRAAFLKAASTTGVLALIAVLFAIADQSWASLLAGAASGYFAHQTWNAFEQIAAEAERRTTQRRTPR
jgi:hypothetical protein